MAVNRIGIETEIDKCIEVLARAKYEIDACKFECSSCKGCTYYLLYSEEYSKLASVDKLKVDQLARDRLMLTNEYNKSIFSKLKFLFKAAIVWFVLIAIILYIAIVILNSKGHPQDYVYPSVIAASDINNDGKINCIDYAISYKLIWDSKNNGSDYRCEIVRNVNKATGMNHLFIRVMNNKYKWEYIEPQVNMLMEDYWGDKYNAAFNIYGETEYWLSKVRR